MSLFARDKADDLRSFHFIAFHTLTIRFTVQMCNEMKRIGLIPHERVEILTDDPLAAFVRNREKYAFLIIRPESSAEPVAQGLECC